MLNLPYIFMFFIESYLLNYKLYIEEEEEEEKNLIKVTITNIYY